MSIQLTDILLDSILLYIYIYIYIYTVHVTCRSGETTSSLIKQHRETVLPLDNFDRVRIIVRRSRILQDTLHLLKNGLDTTKHLLMSLQWTREGL